MSTERIASPDYPAADRARVAAAFQRRQLLEGEWLEQLARHGTKQLGALRAKLVGEWDFADNIFKAVIEQTCTMYDEQPDVAGAKEVADALESGGYWSMARQHQQYVRALHESLVCVGWDPETELSTFQLVPSDYVTVDVAASNRARPVTVWHAKRREVPGNPRETAWFWDRWSTLEGGSFTVWTNDRHRDVSASFPDATRGWAPYPYRDERSKPILPFALYHDRGPATGLWSPACRDQEVVFGTWQLGLINTAAIHGVLRAGWSQRLLFNGRIRGGTTETVVNHAVRTITPDPTAILQVEGEGASAGEWGSPLDIEAVEKFGRFYGMKLGVHFGIPQSDLAIDTMSASSGAAITVSQAGLRRIAKRDTITFRRGDGELAEVVAAVLRANGRPASAASVRYRYRGVSLTIEERVKVGPMMKSEIEMGVADRVTAYQEIHPGTTVEEAEADLAAIDKRRMLEEDRAAALAPDPPQPPADEPDPDADPKADPVAEP